MFRDTVFIMLSVLLCGMSILEDNVLLFFLCLYVNVLLYPVELTPLFPDVVECTHLT
jgi:hypothetical protein